MTPPAHPTDRPPLRMMPAGERWGFGARTVLPYLNHSLQARLIAADLPPPEAGPVRNPVFPEMDIALLARKLGAH
jgi:hypothetical protein